MEKYSKPGLVKSVHVPVPRRMPEDVQEIICDFLCEPQAYWKGLYFLVVREYATLLRTLFERNFQYMLPGEEQLDTVTLERVKEIHELKKDIDVTPSKLTYKALHILHDDPEVCGDEDWSLYCKTWEKKQYNYPSLKFFQNHYNDMRFTGDLRRSIKKCHTICETLHRAYDKIRQEDVRDFYEDIPYYESHYVLPVEAYQPVPCQYPCLKRFCEDWNVEILLHLIAKEAKDFDGYGTAHFYNYPRDKRIRRIPMLRRRLRELRQLL